jgi:hypothetical protein
MWWQHGEWSVTWVELCVAKSHFLSLAQFTDTLVPKVFFCYIYNLSMLKLPPSLIANEVTSILPTSLKAKALHDDLASVGVINVDTDSSDEEDADECDSNDGDLKDFDSKSKRQKLEEYCLDDDDDILIIEEKQVSKNGGAPAARSEATTATKLAGKPAIPVAPKVKVQKMKGSLDYQPKLYNTGSPLDPASFVP